MGAGTRVQADLHISSIRGSKRVSQSDPADIAAGGSSNHTKKCEKVTSKDMHFPESNNGLDPPVEHRQRNHRHSRRRGMDPSVAGTKNGDEHTIQSSAQRSYLTKPSNEVRRRKNAKADPEDTVSLKSKSRRRSSMDPPELLRGDDPSECAPIQSGNSAIQRSLNARRKRCGNRRKASGSFKDTELAKELIIPVPECTALVMFSGNSKKKKSKSMSEPKKQVKVQGILKNKSNIPPPIKYFGGTVSSSSSSDDDYVEKFSSSDCEEESVHKEKSRKIHFDDVDEKSLGSIKSGMRRGKYAAANEAALSVTQRSSDEDSSIESFDSDESDLDEIATEKFDRDHSHFLRTADLGMTQDTIFAQQFLDNPHESVQPHYHHPTPHPPPGVQFHVDENWICVDDGKGNHSPIAPQAVDALVAMGFRSACDPMMWTPTAQTRKTMTEKSLRFDDLPIPGPLCEGEGSPIDPNCLIWHGKFAHKYYGCDIPAFRSQGIVNMSAEDLVDLIMDSDRVSEYNRSSTGRTDEVVLSDGTNLDRCPFSGKRKKKLTGVVTDGAKIIDGTAFIDPEDEGEQSSFEPFTIDISKERKRSKFVGVTKLVRSSNKVPLIKRTLQFTTLLHCRELTDDQGGNGYIIVARAITPADDVHRKEKGVMRSEILLNVHIIRRLGGKKNSSFSSSSICSGKSVNSSSSGRVATKKDLANRCLMINVTHVKSLLIPKLLQRKVGLSAAASFMSDVRSANHH